ncbi:MAG: alpha-2-macroglobulin family protein [Armatimonadota bacterium]
MTIHRFIAVLVIVAAALVAAVLWQIGPLRAQEPSYEQLRNEGERLYAEHSYALAREAYMKAQKQKLSPEEERWVRFRLADTLWRATAGADTPDNTKFDQARKELEALLKVDREVDRDRAWAAAAESLGDFWWDRRHTQNWHQAWPHYQQALDWWAGTKDIEAARGRYLHIVWTASHPSWMDKADYGDNNYYIGSIPQQVLENAVKIAATPQDRSHAQFLLAVWLQRHGGDTAQRRRIPGAFEAALQGGKAMEWYDDVLFAYASWLEQQGPMIRVEAQQAEVSRRGPAQWQQKPDYVKALALYRRLLAEFTQGETRYYQSAKDRIAQITGPVVGVSVSNIFLPGSEIQYHASWRNLQRAELALYKVDLTRDVHSAGDWLQSIDLAAAEKVKAWSKETGDTGDYVPGNATWRFDEKPAPGAYVLEAVGGGKKARDLVLVSDATVVLKTSGTQALVYACDVLNGAPLANAQVSLWDNRNGVQRETKQADENGLAVFTLRPRYPHDSEQIFVAINTGGRQAFSTGYSQWRGGDEDSWRVYAFTDRPAYRPGEQVQWKFTARQYLNSVYTTPANREIEYEITDPRGTKVKSEKVTLNAFGSSFGALDVTDKMPLGEYRVTFWRDRARNSAIGSATLFRLEEYKLPEFKVSVKKPAVDGKRKAFKLGDKVEVTVQADYYFGGPVANATAEVLVYQKSYARTFRPHRDYAWYYDDARSYNYGYRGSVIKQETLKTDATGKATLTFDAPQSGGDLEYTIEARVTDASRREIVGADTVRVSQRLYAVNATPEHNLYRPQDKVTVNFDVKDANDQPQQAEGKVTVTRNTWREIWVSPAGVDVTGAELERLRGRGSFPPPAGDGIPWRLKKRGYETEQVLERTLKTDAEGKAELVFTPERDGYYQVNWYSEDRDGDPVEANTTVWVATNASTDIGFRTGGVQIITDKDTFRAGQTAAIMLTAPTNDRYILFSMEADDLFSYQLVHLTGPVKLLQVPITEQHEPNVFLDAVMVSDRQLYTDHKQVVVPPVGHFLNVEVKADKEQYLPREEGTLTVTARDADGKPVSAEVALGLVDESVYYIQKDYAGDPRQFFYGTKRDDHVRTQGTVQYRRYAQLAETDGRLEDIFTTRREMNEKPGSGYTDGEYAAGQPVPSPSLGPSGPAGPAGGARAKLSLAESSISMNADKDGLGGWADAKGDAAGGGQGGPAVTVRSDFRSTVFWGPEVATDKDGKATVKVKFPDSLTGWKATARLATAGNQFGIAEGSARTKQPLIVRLQAPRFFVVGDEVTISAVVNNNTDEQLSVTPDLEAGGAFAGFISKDTLMQIPANSERRIDWHLPVMNAGDGKLKVTVHGGKYADAMEKTYPVYEHGVEKLLAKSGKVRGKDTRIALELPKRKTESTELTVQVAPSLATTALDALPYLIDYPYGCTEQTMSRFLPTVIAAKTLQELGLRREDIAGKLFGGIEAEYTDKTHPQGKQDLARMDAMIAQGLDRLYDFQHGDGGWGWWKNGNTDHYMTAYVVWGLSLAKDAGVTVRQDVLDRGADYLRLHLVEEEERTDLQSWMLHALAAYRHSLRGDLQMSDFEKKAFDNLWEKRDRLNAYTRAMFALSAQYYQRTEQAQALARNLANGVQVDKTPDVSVVMEGPQASLATVLATAHWGSEKNYWRWSEGGIEATAFALRALLAIDPKNPLVESSMNWLVKNRRGAQWTNTRDTSFAVLALCDYLSATGELVPEAEFEVLVNGQRVGRQKVTAKEALGAPSRFAVDRKLLKDGKNEVRIRRLDNGDGPLYFSTQASFVSLEEPVTPAGNEIFARRAYYKSESRPTLLKGTVYEQLPLLDGGTVTSGDRVDVVITVEAKNDYDYLVFEDLKPAGLEAVQLRSGEAIYARELRADATDRTFLGGKVDREAKDYTGRTAWIYQELRDRKVALFIDHLPQGVWEIHYQLRAEVPGQFHALPVLGHAMYVPEIRCNGAEIRMTVADK